MGGAAKRASWLKKGGELHARRRGPVFADRGESPRVRLASLHGRHSAPHRPQSSTKCGRAAFVAQAADQTCQRSEGAWVCRPSAVLGRAQQLVGRRAHLQKGSEEMAVRKFVFLNFAHEEALRLRMGALGQRVDEQGALVAVRRRISQPRAEQIQKLRGWG